MRTTGRALEEQYMDFCRARLDHQTIGTGGSTRLTAPFHMPSGAGRAADLGPI